MFKSGDTVKIVSNGRTGVISRIVASTDERGDIAFILPDDEISYVTAAYVADLTPHARG